jgi:catechol 2,3-dioxygenase-like lactoylglutathione lyase family enzyme
MITGAHVTVFSQDAKAAQAFFREVLGLEAVDAGGGWWIFALPPTEVAFHPSGPDTRHELFLMCDDIEATVARMREHGVEFTAPVSDEGFGLMTRFRLPGAGEMGLYEPRHPRPPAA